ncbi:MAG: hypothetical protein GX567_05600 [Clostridia bacterium]|nr:hypothetical protein [Clostridia bacterium]
MEKYNDFFKALSESDLTYYTAYGYDVDTTDKGNTIREQIITEKFLDIFNLSAISGRLLNKDDFNTKNDTVPVMVGYELQDHYKLGNTYELFNGGTGEYFKGLVVGILSKNSEYYELNSVNVALPLDYSYIVPQSIQDTSNMGFSDLDMAETRMVVFGSKNEIQKIISTKSPIDITLIGVIDKIDELLRTHRNEIILLIIILIAIALISICVMWIFYYHIFKKQFHAYNIHYIFGATNSSLYMRFWIISFFIVLVSGGISIAVFHLIPYVTEIMIFALIFATITGSIPVLLIRKKMMR